MHDATAVDLPTSDVSSASDVVPTADATTADATTADATTADAATRGLPGAPCQRDSDCGPRGECLTPSRGWTGGYCIRPCEGLDATSCGDGAVCSARGAAFACLAACSAAEDCRDGYHCVRFGERPGVCFPRCTALPAGICGAAACDDRLDICFTRCTSESQCASGSTCSTETSRCVCGPQTACGEGRGCLPATGQCGCTSDRGCALDRRCNLDNGECLPRTG